MAEAEQQSQSGEGRSLATYLVWLSTLSVGALLLLSVLLVAVHLRGLLEQQQEARVQREVSLLHLSLQGWLSDRLASMVDNAQWLSVALAAGQSPQQSVGSLSIFGEPVEFYLLTPAGKPVARNSDLYSWPRIETDPQLLSRQHADIVEHPNGMLWQLQVPVFHQAKLRGVLVSKIPMSQMAYQLKLIDYFPRMHLRIERDQRVLVSLGRIVEGARTVSKPWPALNLTLQYEFNAHTLSAPLNEVVRELLLLGGVMLLLLGGCSYALARYWLVKPVLRLQKAVTEFSQGQCEGLQDLQIRSRIAPLPAELMQLSQKFRWLAANVQNRERELRARNQQLQTLMEDLRAQQAKLVNSERMASIGTLAAGAAHEINNPLGFVKSNLTTLDCYLKTLMPLLCVVQQHHNQVDFADRLHGELHKIAKQDDLQFLFEDLPILLAESSEGVSRIESITNGLKTFASQDHQRDAPTNLNECVRAALALLNHDLETVPVCRIELSVLPPVRAVKSQLTQMVLNILRNALQAMNDVEEKQLIVRTLALAGEVRLLVTDNGCGIAEVDLGRVFTPFFTKRQIGEGVGLGLSISHNIAEHYHGQIEIDSIEQQGTTVSVTLPAVMVMAEQPLSE